VEKRVAFDEKGLPVQKEKEKSAVHHQRASGTGLERREKILHSRGKGVLWGGEKEDYKTLGTDPGGKKSSSGGTEGGSAFTRKTKLAEGEKTARHPTWEKDGREKIDEREGG